MASARSSYHEEAVELLKQQGNAACKAKDWKQAVQHYTEAIEKAVSSGATDMSIVLFSNRSFARLQMGVVQLALQDADHCVQRLPGWDRGWWRKAEVLHKCQAHEETIECLNAAIGSLNSGQCSYCPPPSDKARRQRLKACKKLLKTATSALRAERLLHHVVQALLRFYEAAGVQGKTAVSDE